MDPLSPPLCTLPPGPEPPRFVCYCEREGSGEGEGGGFNLYVTDAAELWSTCFTPDSLAALKARFGLSAAEDITPRFRAACEQQAVALTLQEDRASLTLSGGPSALAFDLSKVPGPEAASRLQALTLGLAKRVWSLERRLAAAEETAASPRKSPRPAGSQRFLPGKACTPVTQVGLCALIWNSVSPEQASCSRENACLFGEGCGWGAARFRSVPMLFSPRPRSPERWPWTWGQEAVSGRVTHQPWVQEVPCPPAPSCTQGPTLDPTPFSTP
ncbi:hypothetical protein H8959_012126 [Pygathrix nigripes]